MKLFPRASLDVKFTRSSTLPRGILYFLISLLSVLALTEIIARSPLGSNLPAPSVQADSFLFDAKIYALEAQIRRQGKIDCLFLGSSVANSDIDPAVVEEVFHSNTGDSIHCYNLGMPALTLENATAIAAAVIQRYQPGLIIYAVLPRDINDVTANMDPIEKIDWVKYNRGTPSLNGWLINHSHGWRYFLTWRYWLTPANRLKMQEDTHGLTQKGYQPAEGIRDPYIPNLTMTPERLREVWSDPRRALALERFLALGGEKVTIILLEGPAYHETGESDAETWRAYQDDYLPGLLEILEANGTTFWRTNDVSLQIPKSHWYDWLHLNRLGAETFSRWLGAKMAENADLVK